ncbi:parallel beta-helix domain-containing protein [Caulobacter sp. 17J80-11]|uniref:parallel beta-helix domain-containing protein n=1 Tax=Caulobacter sp. 17J80-11 TaxID=2763502 RepID=UPI001653A668|nr:parallel beta-helix domain-containing protein [Caulobacter sp. 17J80-11]MBC6982594.1 right-handed parallel beta-helix repeat-containing protein [Caulobacter sp. 17J80-11]
MTVRKYALSACAVSALMALAACDQAPKAGADGLIRDPAFETKLQEQLLDAKAGDVITIPAGKYLLTKTLSLAVDGVTIRGAGMDKTVLSFAGQVSGGEGVNVTGNGVTVEDIGIEDAGGNGFKANGVKDLTLRRVRAEWTAGPNPKNGAYGLYPVQTQNLLIEDCVVKGASDAGIYVGQSRNIVVRNNRAEYNVAGIEIENSIGADVYGNTATNNTGGILVFNMPNIPVSGIGTRVYKNQVFANNTKNFAAEGAAVRSVPAGSGVLINSNDGVEIFDNDIHDNKTLNVGISSYYSTGYQNKTGIAPNFDPYPEQIYVTGNRFKGGGDAPDGQLGVLKLAMFGLKGRLPDVLWDGWRNPKVKSPEICIDNGEAEVLNIDGPNKYANPKIDASFRCQPKTRLPAVVLTGALADKPATAN